MASATRELLAAPDELWAFIAEPHHLGDWWPGVLAVEPDRRGFALGARWRIVRRGPRGPVRLAQGSWLGRARSETLVITELEPPRLWGFELVGRATGPLPPPRLAARVELEQGAGGRARARVSVAGGALAGSRDRLTAQAALERLYALVQTAASL